jgi:hypothetical protein
LLLIQLGQMKASKNRIPRLLVFGVLASIGLANIIYFIKQRYVVQIKDNTFRIIDKNTYIGSFFANAKEIEEDLDSWRFTSTTGVIYPIV